MFFSWSKINEEYFPTKIDNYLAVNEEPSLLPFRTDSFVNENTFSFSKSIDSCVQYKHNQISDAFGKYVVKYHIL